MEAKRREGFGGGVGAYEYLIPSGVASQTKRPTVISLTPLFGLSRVKAKLFVDFRQTISFTKLSKNYDPS